MLNLITRLLSAVRVRLWRLMVPLAVKSQGVSIGRRVEFFGFPIVSRVPGTSISIGDRVVLISDSRYTALGVSRPSVLRTMLHGASITIGSDSGLSGVTVCAAVYVAIGKNCLIGADVMIVDNDFHPIAALGRRYSKDPDRVARAPVIIEDDVFVGARSIVLKGVVIGKGAVVGAGSVVVSNIPPGAVVAGNPARVIRGDVASELGGNNEQPSLNNSTPASMSSDNWHA